jgi:DNA-binding response OmpR family regulator
MPGDTFEHPPRILIVEDHANVAADLRTRLIREGYVVQIATTSDLALSVLEAEPFDLLILDLGLPGRDGFSLLSDLRARGDRIRVLIVTARESMSICLRCLDGGADDYLVKPFQMPEVVARIRSLLRRVREEDLRRIRVADLEVDLITRQASRAGRSIELAPREFALLAYLMNHAGRVVSREMLGRDVWNQLHRGSSLDNVIDVHIGRLRRKVDAQSELPLIHTVRGLGFKVSAERPR